MNRTVAIGVLGIVGVMLVGIGLVVGVALGSGESVGYPTPEEAVQRYIESTSDPGQAPGFELKGMLPVWNGVLVLYTTPGPPGTELLGYRLAKHGASGWLADTGVSFGVPSPPNPNDVIEWHADSRVDYSPELNGVVETAVAFGRTTFSGVAVVEVVFDQGQTHQTVSSGGFFAVAAVGATDVQVVRALAANGTPIIVIDKRNTVE